MTQPRLGIWFVGAWGGVATTATVGLAKLQAGNAPETGLVTALPLFAKAGLAPWSEFVVGGHEIRKLSYLEAAQRLYEQSHVFSPALLETVAERLAEFDANVRPGTLINVGPTIEGFAEGEASGYAGEAPSAAIERISNDLQEFRTAHNLDHVIVVNVSSTEPPPAEEVLEFDWDSISKGIESDAPPPLPASTVYAIAAFVAECSYVNFTPSLGTDLPGLKELALEQGTLHVGRDGKTGETLLKSVLAPMFAARNLRVQSWVGHNIFGNLDGKVLDDPVNKASKVHSKDHLLGEILGYLPQTLVSIEYIESMGDWKTAWDHIHFNGFLDTKMTMQFTWQGCDSLLAAPLVLDLVRLTEREWRRGKSGVMTHLASFFKSPMGENISPQFALQFQQLEAWANTVSSEA
jgi:myo-inositol-1-phosphate synthase